MLAFNINSPNVSDPAVYGLEGYRQDVYRNAGEYGTVAKLFSGTQNKWNSTLRDQSWFSGERCPAKLRGDDYCRFIYHSSHQASTSAISLILNMLTYLYTFDINRKELANLMLRWIARLRRADPMFLVDEFLIVVPHDVERFPGSSRPIRMTC